MTGIGSLSNMNCELAFSFSEWSVFLVRMPPRDYKNRTQGILNPIRGPTLIFMVYSIIKGYWSLLAYSRSF